MFHRPDPSAPDVSASRPDGASDAAPQPTPQASPQATAPDAQPDPTMIVRAPTGGDPAAAPAPAPAADQGATPTAATATSGDGRPQILVVEDNDDTRMLLDRILRSEYAVTAVGDARSALIEMNRAQFAGLVLDINLGGKETGADILRIARTLEGYREVYAIALTAYALPGDRERLLEAGFDEYISKPFTRHSLMEALAAGVKL